MVPLPQFNFFVRRTSPYVSRSGFEFCILFLLFISFALLNNFPLYIPDSASYTGDLDYNNTMRSPIPGLIAAPLYPFIGVWSLPVINSAVVAFMLVRFTQVFKTGMPIFAAAGLATMAGLPFFTSLISPDVWIVVLVIAVILLIVRWTTIDLAVAGIALAGHGSNFICLFLMLPIALIFYPARARTLSVFVTVGTLGMAILFCGNVIVSKTFFPETWAPAILASKMMIDVPAAVDDLCTNEPTQSICVKWKTIPKPHDPDAKAQYVWGDDFTFEELSDSSLTLFRLALFNHPLELAAQTLHEWRRAYSPNNGLDVGYLIKAEDNSFIHYIIDQDHGRFVRKGWLYSKYFGIPFYALHTTLVVGALLFSLFSFGKLAEGTKAVLIIMWSAVVINDFVFALLSGMYGRYHLRVLGIFVPIVLLTFTAARISEKRMNKMVHAE